METANVKPPGCLSVLDNVSMVVSPAKRRRKAKEPMGTGCKEPEGTGQTQAGIDHGPCKYGRNVLSHGEENLRIRSGRDVLCYTETAEQARQHLGTKTNNSPVKDNCKKQCDPNETKPTAIKTNPRKTQSRPTHSLGSDVLWHGDRTFDG